MGKFVGELHQDVCEFSDTGPGGLFFCRLEQHSGNLSLPEQRCHRRNHPAKDRLNSDASYRVQISNQYFLDDNPTAAALRERLSQGGDWKIGAA